MIPGVGTDLLSKNDERISQIRLKKMMCIMDSMTDSGMSILVKKISFYFLSF